MDTKMQTSISKRGQTVVPAPIRRRYSIQEGDCLVWIDDGKVIKVIPVPADPIRALRGRSKGHNLYEALMKYRAEERQNEI